MKSKEVRKNILHALYEERSKFMVTPDDLLNAINVSDIELDTEIRYLSDKGLVKIKGEFMGRMLNFAGVQITAIGIDAVEDPDSFGKIFSLNINQVNADNGSSVSAAIVDQGTNNTYQDIETVGFDVGMINKGKNNKVTNFNSSRKGIFASTSERPNWWMQIVIAVIAGLIVVGSAYYLGWS